MANIQTVSGAGTSATQTNAIDPLSAAAFGTGAATIQAAGQNIWGLVLTTIISALGAYKQFEMFRKQGNLAQEQADATKAFSLLQRENFDKINLPQYKKSDSFFWTYLRGGFSKDIETKVAECGLRYCEYQGDEDEDVSSAYADSYDIINNLRLKSKRSLSPFQAGECFDNSYRLDALEAQMLVVANSAAKRRYDSKKLAYDQFYWQKYTQVAQMAGNINVVGAGLLTGSVNAVQASLNAQGQTLQTADLAVQSQFAALNGQQATIGAAANRLNGAIGDFVGQRNGAEFTAGTEAFRQRLTQAGGSSAAGGTAQAFPFVFGPGSNVFGGGDGV